MLETADGYRVELLARQAEVGPDEIVELWMREGVLDAGEAARRAGEVLVVATEAGGGLVGVSTAYARHNERLRMDLWNVRVFVARAHRATHVAAALAGIGMAHLRDEFESGRDTRGAGIFYEVEAAVLKSDDRAVWRRTRAVFIGEDEHGRHLRVRYFPSAVAPGPPEA